MMFIFFLSIEAKEKYSISVCAIFKDESKFLKEWVEYHQIIGVDHFYLYSNSEHPTEVLEKYVKEGIVSLVQWPDYTNELQKQTFVWALSTQTVAFQHAIIMNAQETEWLVFLDVNEFLVPEKNHSLKTMLEKYKSFPGVQLTTKYYDSSVLGKDSLVIESLLLVSESNKNVYRSVEKTIFKPKLCKSFSWPPFRCKFENGLKAIQLESDEVCINHYESRKRWRLKSKKTLDFGNYLPTKREIDELTQEGFAVEDQKKSIQRILPELRKKMECFK